MICSLKRARRDHLEESALPRGESLARLASFSKLVFRRNPFLLHNISRPPASAADPGRRSRRLQLQGWRLQGCKIVGVRLGKARLWRAGLQAAGCKAAGCKLVARQQAARVQATSCKVAGCKAAGDRLRTARLQAPGLQRESAILLRFDMQQKTHLS